MKKSGIAAIAAAAVLVVGGGTAYALATNDQGDQGPAVVEATATSTPTPTPTASEAPAEASPEPEATSDYITENDDAGYLAEVEKRTWRVTVLDEFTDAELIEMGHEGCTQIGEGAKLEDLRLVDGEAMDTGAWRDTSAIFNSALLHYCPQLIEDIG